MTTSSILITLSAALVAVLTIDVIVMSLLGQAIKRHERTGKAPPASNAHGGVGSPRDS